jgi:hypothetical protein
VADADSAAADEVSEFTRPEFWVAIGTIAAVPAGVALVVAGAIAHDHVASALGSLLVGSMFPLSWMLAAIEIRAGRAEPAKRWTRSKWKWKLLWMLPTSAVFACVLGVTRGRGAIVEGAAVGAFMAALDPLSEAVSIVARRVLAPPPGFAPAPALRLIGSKTVFGWIAATVASGAASIALGLFGFLTSAQGVFPACVAFLGLSVLFAWKRRRVGAVLGAPRWVVR